MEKNSIPSVIHLYPSMRCQLNCKYCYVNAVNKELEELSLEEYESVIRQAIALGIVTFDIAGGEPFIYGYIMELLKMIKRMGGFSKVVTNGYYLDRYVELLKQEKGLIKELHVSLDSVRADIHDETRGCKGLFDKVIKNLTLYKKKMISPVRINYVLQKGTYLELEEMLDYLETQGIDGIDIQYVEDVSDKTKNGDFTLNCQELVMAVERIITWKMNTYANLDILIALPSYIFAAFSPELKKRLKESGVQTIYYPGLLRNNYFKEAVIIKQNGDVTGCTGYINEEQWVCANVRETTLETIIKEAFPNMRTRLESLCSRRLGGECKDCPSKRFCRGNEGVLQKEEIVQCPIKENLINYITRNREER